MEKYNPSQPPNPKDWVELDESIRIDLVREYHEENDEEAPKDAIQLHAAIHVVVENQAAMGVEPVSATIAKLVRQGLNRHEAVHAVGAILSEDIYNLLQGNQKEHSLKNYRKRLEKLTAKRWKKGRW